MSDLLSIGASGVRGYSRALATVGDNIANAQTPGYARRSVTLAEQPASGDAVFYRNQVMPGGVLATGVVRATDPWLVEDARMSASDAAQSGARLTWLEATETSLADGGAGVGPAMTAFFNSADALAADPSNSARRSAFLQGADDIATSFRRTADGLARNADGVATSARLAADQLNTDLTALARVNEGLRRARDASSNQATLLDERDRLLNSISAALPVDVALDAKGAASLTIGGDPVLSGGDRAIIGVLVAPDGRLAFSAAGPVVFAVAPQSGLLAGLADAANHIAGQRSGLDALANGFAAAVNTQHATGRDANGSAGTPLFAIGAGATDLTAVALTAAQVAAGDGTTENGNALAFAGLRGAGGGEQSWAALVAVQSQQVASARAQNDVASARRDGAAAARDELSAVDLDREAGELMRYQQAYEAAARVIQVARETMQSILNAV